jgi:hypothetical protein
MRSSTIIGGSSDKNQRNPADFYATPPECTKALIKAFRPLFSGKTIWEPACGDGAISRVLESEGFKVRSSDIYNRGYGRPGVDFLKSDCKGGSIITNPPFNLAAEFIQHSASFGVPFAMLLKATYWHAAKRYDLFYDTGPIAVLPLAWRPAMSPERGKSATMDFCWTVWDRKPSPKTGYYIQKRPF